jgi:serine/threonine protein phosphatase PrpC
MSDFVLVDKSLSVYMLSDGSSDPTGLEAAKMACAVVTDFIARQKNAIQDYNKRPTFAARVVLQNMIRAAIQAAAQQVFSAKGSKEIGFHSSCTMEVLLILADYAILGHVGNSCTFSCLDGRVVRWGEDHTYYEYKIRSGDQPVPNDRKTLSRAIGIGDTVLVDVFAIPLFADTKFLICSNGLSDIFADTGDLKGAEFGRMAESWTIKELPQALVELGIKRDSRDDVSALVIEVLPDPAIREVLKGQIDFLRGIRALNYLKEDDVAVARLLSVLTPRTCQIGADLVSENTSGDQMFFIRRGVASVLADKREVHRRGAGDVIGEINFFTSKPRTATVRAAEQMEVLVLSKRDFDILAYQHPKIALKFAIGVINELSAKLIERR